MTCRGQKTDPIQKDRRPRSAQFRSFAFSFPASDLDSRLDHHTITRCWRLNCVSHWELSWSG